MGIINIDILTTKLIKIRDQSKHSRKYCANQVLEYLGLQNSSISTKQFDALLIRAIAEHFDDSRDADVLLMAFGLLQCYHYTEIISIGDRRKKYLAKSNYLQTHPRKQEPYESAALGDVDTASPEYRQFERQLYESVLERMGFDELLVPRQAEPAPELAQLAAARSDNMMEVSQ